jgi:hypothetical protein
VGRRARQWRPEPALIEEAPFAGGTSTGALGVSDGAIPLREYVMALPPAVSLQTADKILSLRRSTGYGPAKLGEYPCKVLKPGNAYRVVTADLQRLLALNGPADLPTPVPPRVYGVLPRERKRHGIAVATLDADPYRIREGALGVGCPWLVALPQRVWRVSDGGNSRGHSAHGGRPVAGRLWTPHHGVARVDLRRML